MNTRPLTVPVDLTIGTLHHDISIHLRFPVFK